jgi:hypothetical protein
VAVYSTTQIVHSFTFTVGSAADLKFDNQSGEGVAAMQTYVELVAKTMLEDKAVHDVIGLGWVSVWGPVVYARDTSGPTVVADNTMAVYYNPFQNLFVVAVAGTNPLSPFDWFGQDFDVHNQVPWTKAGGNGSGHISAGANNGLQIVLQKMTDANGKTMLEALSGYLKLHVTSKTTIAVGGHSLGGALSPCLALYMYDNATTLGLSGHQISVFATAGPTPGDATWASNYEELITAGSITYSSLYNTLDVVPLAWQPSDLGAIPTLYVPYKVPPDMPNNNFVGMLVSDAQLYALDAFFTNSYMQVTNNHTALLGTFNTTVDDDVAAKLTPILTRLLPDGLQPYVSTIVYSAQFVAQAASQHISAYPPLLQITEFYAQYKDTLAKCKPTMATQIDPIKAAVLKTVGVDLDRVAAAGEAVAKRA